MIIKNLYIEITGYCNLNCFFCYNSNVRDKTELSLDNFKFIINNILKENTIEHIIFSGGEPLLNRNLKEMILFIISKDIQNITIITNGMVIDESIFNIIAKYGLKIQLSYNPSLHENSVVNRYKFFIKKVIDFQINHLVSLNTILTNDNYMNQISISSNFANKYKLKNIIFNKIMYNINMGNFDKFKHLIVTKENEEKIKKYLESDNLLYKNVSYESVDVRKKCVFGTQIISEMDLQIDLLGNAYVCSRLQYSELKLFNIYKDYKKLNLLNLITNLSNKIVNEYKKCDKCVSKNFCNKFCPSMVVYDRKESDVSFECIQHKKWFLKTVKGNSNEYFKN